MVTARARTDSAMAYVVDACHSGVHFWVRHLLVARIRGKFTQWRTELAVDEKNLARSEVQVWIDASSIDTGDPERDAHLRSAAFLDVERFPEIRYQSKGIRMIDGRRYEIDGALTVRGITLPVMLEATLVGRIKEPWGEERIAFEALARVSRARFGIDGGAGDSSATGPVISDTITIEIEIEAVAEGARSKSRWVP